MSIIQRHYKERYYNHTIMENLSPFELQKLQEENPNKIIVIKFSAEWCVPCKKELPDLSLLNLKLKKHNIEVLTISIDKKNIKEQLSFLFNNGVSDLNHFFDNDMKIYKALKLRGIPTTILVNKKGLVVSKHEGILKWGEAKVVNDIINLLN